MPLDFTYISSFLSQVNVRMKSKRVGGGEECYELRGRNFNMAQLGGQQRKNRITIADKRREGVSQEGKGGGQEKGGSESRGKRGRTREERE